MNDPDPSLSLSPDDMRAFGYRVVDLMVRHFETLSEKSVPHASRRSELEERLREPLPGRGTDVDELFARLEEDVFGHISHVDHPRFFAFIPSPGNFVSAMADAMASGFNVFAGTWIESSGPAVVELTTIDWLRALCGLPETAGGLFLSGGSMANLTALAAARHVRLEDRTAGAVVYYSDQTHSSVDRGLRVLGFAPDQIRRLPSDRAYRLDLAALREAVAADRAAGRRPFAVVANAGTTNTGAVDPLVPLAGFCREEELWLHADGAYGAAAVFCEPGRRALAGLELVDSLSIDPHKWLFQPYEIGCVLVRDARWLKEAFHILPEYMHDTQLGEEAVNFCDYGIQLTRSFRALKLWLSIKAFGAEAFAEAVRRGIRQAEEAEQLVRAMPGWEVTSPAQLGILSFRFAPSGTSEAVLDDVNLGALKRLHADGHAMFSTTVLEGRTVIRMCLINPRTTPDDVRGSLERLDAFAREHAAGD